MWTKVVRPKKYFQKKNYKYEILNHLYFGPSFNFCGTALGHFSQCFFFNFLSLVNHGDRHFHAAPHHKKAFYGHAIVHTFGAKQDIVSIPCFTVLATLLEKLFCILRSYGKVLLISKTSPHICCPKLMNMHIYFYIFLFPKFEYFCGALRKKGFYPEVPEMLIYNQNKQC